MRNPQPQPLHRGVLCPALSACLCVLACSGCTGRTAELQLQPFAETVQRIPLGADNDIPRFFLGFPTRTAGNRAWWYLRPGPDGPATAGGGLSAFIRFNENKKVIERELIAWLPTGRGGYRLTAERLIAADGRPDDADFAAVLGEKLGELAAREPRYRFTSQEVSYQFAADGVLLLSMDRWSRPGSRLTGLRGEIDPAAHPQAVEAIRLAWQIRRFAIELEFEPRGRTQR